MDFLAEVVDIDILKSWFFLLFCCFAVAHSCAQHNPGLALKKIYFWYNIIRLRWLLFPLLAAELSLALLTCWHQLAQPRICCVLSPNLISLFTTAHIQKCVLLPVLFIWNLRYDSSAMLSVIIRKKHISVARLYTENPSLNSVTLCFAIQKLKIVIYIFILCTGY